ncbi:MAG: class I SAM-dependent methyltransferase, partial [Anderseniella sp.]
MKTSAFAGFTSWVGSTFISPATGGNSTGLVSVNPDALYTKDIETISLVTEGCMNKPTPSSLPAKTRNTAPKKHQTAGYYHGIDWMPVYQANLNPNHIEFVLDANGKEAPDLSSACEIAYGFGYSLVLHPACNANCQFTGTDFNPRHYDFASSLSSDLGLKNLVLYDQSIEEFCGQMDNSRYDFIGLTGTWSWLPASNQNNVLAFAAATLGKKGLLYFDYMTRPGGDTITTLRTAMLAY